MAEHGRGSKAIIKQADLQGFISSACEERPSGAATSSGQRKCERWLEGLMSASPAKKNASKKELWQKAKKDFAVSERGFERAWAGAVAKTGAAAWSAAGRLKGRNRRT